MLGSIQLLKQMHVFFLADFMVLHLAWIGPILSSVWATQDILKVQ